MSNNTSGLYNSMQYTQNILIRISIPYIIIVSLIGIPGNVLTIIMLSKRSLTKNFNNCTLIALALTDFLFNLTLVTRCISDLIKFNSNDFCHILSFLSHLAELLSACFTAHFTIQRFIAVRFPLSVFIEKNIHLLHKFIVILFIICGISFCSLLIKKNNLDSCEEELQLSWFILDALFSFVIPFTIIAVLNLLIIFHLRKKSRNNRSLSLTQRTKKRTSTLKKTKKHSILFDSSSQSKSPENSAISNIKTLVYNFPTHEEPNEQYLTVNVGYHHRTASIRSTTRSHAQSHRVTRMLILVSTCFLLLNAPAHICTITLKLYTAKISQLINNSMQIYLNQTNISNGTISIKNENVTLISMLPSTYKENQLKFYHIFYIIVIITHHISYISYSINFFLYSFCGMKFRRELKKVLLPSGKYQEPI